MKIKNKNVEDLLNFINQSPTSFQVVKNTADILIKNGYKELNIFDKWYLKNNERYFIRKNDSALIAFITGNNNPGKEGYRIISSHTDSPGFRIKPAPEIIQDNKYLKLNTEVYGGPILNTWLDRPLALAGRVSYIDDNPLKAVNKPVNINKPILNIPNLAIHMNPEVNKGIELDKQKHLLPLLTLIDNELEKENFLLSLLAKETGISIDEILEFDLFLYEHENGKLTGLNDEFISAGRLDDLAMVHASLKSLLNTVENDATRVMALFDNEEVGSMTKQGANSPFLASTLERIILRLGYSREDYFCALSNSFMISADMAHAVHPNYSEKHDPSNKNYLNGGPVIKISANQRYTSDSESISICKNLCKTADIPYQVFVNRSDQRGGSTIGPLSASQLDIRAVDIGNPLLAMHSIRELAGVEDHLHIIKLFDTFYNI